jgi:DNA-binding CsgD family transcriptional regulator/PAS domain-containing protein
MEPHKVLDGEALAFGAEGAKIRVDAARADGPLAGLAMAEPAEALETIELLYQAALEPVLWPAALSKLAQAVGGLGTAMIPITPHNTAGLVVSPELAEANVEYEREWWRHDTRVLRIFSRRLSDGVCCEAQLFSDDELARDPLRQEFLRSYGIGAFAAHLVAPLPDFVVAFSVQRALERGQFDKQELKTLDLLGRHAARALVMSTRLQAVRSIEQSLADALAQFDCGAVIADSELKIVVANDAASRLMGDGLSLNHGQLRATHPDHQSALAGFMKSVLRRDADANDFGPIALPRPSGRRPLIVQAIPITADPIDGGPTAGGTAALVLIVDPERESGCKPVKALGLLGLTPSEARLAALIGAGHTRAEAAEVLGIAESTASDTVKQIYAKLDISRQSELVRLVDRLAVLRSPCPDR